MSCIKQWSAYGEKSQRGHPAFVATTRHGRVWRIKQQDPHRLVSFEQGLGGFFIITYGAGNRRITPHGLRQRKPLKCTRDAPGQDGDPVHGPLAASDEDLVAREVDVLHA